MDSIISKPSKSIEGTKGNPGVEMEVLLKARPGFRRSSCLMASDRSSMEDGGGGGGGGRCDEVVGVGGGCDEVLGVGGGGGR